jgi:hypothetical protein
MNQDGKNVNDTPFHTTPNYGDFMQSDKVTPWSNHDLNIPDSHPNEPGRDPVYNIMNYTDDRTATRFTDDQLYRIWIAIQENMSGIWPNDINKANKRVNNKINYIVSSDYIGSDNVKRNFFF